MIARATFWQRFCRYPTAIVGLVILVLVMAVAFVGPIVYGGDPWAMVAAPFIWPGQDPAYPLGSDSMGRDVLSGLIHGARVSLFIGVAATCAAVLIGVLVGSAAGYFRGLIDDALMRFTEVFQTIPNFLFAIVLVAIFQPSITVICFAIAVVSWPPVARLVRGQFLTLRQRAFVESCVVIGMSTPRIIFTQILPNCVAPIIVTASIMVATAILLEAGLSFLGLGDPNVMSWGAMIGFGRQSLRTAWYLAAIPGIAIQLTVLAISFVGEGLNDALNPRLG
ncbi:MAG: ABC transporter permease [Burkholderiales bacterium]|nr:ABC transporter permease [Burkholderiales bacterium]OJX09181.1 MAG: ABC transporter permease [Burkholderiales bacterium 70-64]